MFAYVYWLHDYQSKRNRKSVPVPSSIWHAKYLNCPSGLANQSTIHSAPPAFLLQQDLARRLDLTADSGSGAVSGLGDTDGGRVGPGVLPHRVQLGVLSRMRDERSALGEFTTANSEQVIPVSDLLL